MVTWIFLQGKELHQRTVYKQSSAVAVSGVKIVSHFIHFYMLHESRYQIKMKYSNLYACEKKYFYDTCNSNIIKKFELVFRP